MMQNIAGRLAQTKHIREILENPTDLRALRGRPTFRTVIGLILIGFSYLIGWPAVAALSFLAAVFREPMVVVVGGPVTYGLSHVVFLVGAWLAGAHYIKILTRYAMETLFRKLLQTRRQP